ncbi:helix-hairpin-helix domain-containing protein [Streptococcaceae bacterium ESL0729]|nr:helix-hairpin-helix domain-containing protein [Streptococcaceae bacterium ESL0729]
MEMKDYLKTLRKNKYFLSGSLAVVVLSLSIFAFLLVNEKGVSRKDQEMDSSSLLKEFEQKEQENQEADSDDGSKGRQEFLMVDVKGEVMNPGIYKLKLDSRVDDALKLAGGISQDGDPKSINLAQKLSDEMVVYVAKIGDESAPTGSEKNQPNLASSKEDQVNKVNINTADLAELQTLPGVGLKKAQDILSYRQENGNFKSADDLKKVGGFGSKSLEKLKDSILIK